MQSVWTCCRGASVRVSGGELSTSVHAELVSVDARPCTLRPASVRLLSMWSRVRRQFNSDEARARSHRRSALSLRRLSSRILAVGQPETPSTNSRHQSTVTLGPYWHGDSPSPPLNFSLSENFLLEIQTLGQNPPF